jgi:hypothetical protein
LGAQRESFGRVFGKLKYFCETDTKVLPRIPGCSNDRFDPTSLRTEARELFRRDSD